MNPARLFYCCTGHAVPDWSQFDRLEIGGCVRDSFIDGFTIGGAPASAAEFFTVYGRFKAPDGTHDAITDADSALDALAVAAELSALSGLPCIVCPSLMERRP